MEMINVDELVDVLEHQCLVFLTPVDNGIIHVHLDMASPAAEPATLVAKVQPSEVAID